MAKTKIVELGPNSWSINYSAGATSAEVFALVKQACFNGGWQVYDAESTTSCVFRAPMVDAAEVYKYVKLEATTETLALEVYESWNATTHIGINKSYMGPTSGIFAQRLNFTSGGCIFVFSNQRWLVLYSRIPESTGKYIYGSLSGSSWTGCLEILKENAGEVTGQYPRFAWINSYALMGYLQYEGTPSYASGQNSEYHHYAVPRSLGNLVNQAASKNCIMSNIMSPILSREARSISGGWCDGNEYTVKQLQYVENARSSTAFPSNTSPFGVIGRAVSVTPYAYDKLSGVRGAFCGLKLLSSASGSALDTVALKVNPEDYKSSIFGTPMTHIILGDSTDIQGRVAIPI